MINWIKCQVTWSKGNELAKNGLKARVDIQEEPGEFRWAALVHPSYSPGLAPNKYYFFSLCGEESACEMQPPIGTRFSKRAAQWHYFQYDKKL